MKKLILLLLILMSITLSGCCTVQEQKHTAGEYEYWQDRLSDPYLYKGI